MAKSPKFMMDHFKNPKNVGEIPDADGVGTVGNASCGDIMQMFLKFQDNKILDAKFKTYGCGAAIATSSILTERIKGTTIEEALKISEETVKEIIAQLPKEKTPCFTIAAEALKMAIEEYRCKVSGIQEKGGFDSKGVEKG